MKLSKILFSGVAVNIIVLGWVSLLTDVGSNMVFPLIPVYLKTQLGANGLIIGLVAGSAGLVANILKAFSGYLSDRVKKRKIFVAGGYFISAICKPLFAATTNWIEVLAIRIFERTGKGIRDAPRDAIIAESALQGRMGKSFGLHRTLDEAGSLLGAITAVILLPILGFKNIFILAFIPSIIAVGLIYFVKEPPISKKKVAGWVHSISELPRQLKAFLLVIAILELSNYGYSFILLKGLASGLSPQMSVGLYVIFYFAAMLMSLPSGITADRWGRKKVLVLGGFTFIGTSIGLALTNNVLWIILLSICYGIYFSIFDSIRRTVVSDLTPSSKLDGTAQGLFNTTIGLAALPAGLIAGFLWDGYGAIGTFGFGAILTTITIIPLLLINLAPLRKE